jgi:type I restriction enzyme, S subunit
MSREGWKTYNLEDFLDALIDYRGKTPRKTSHGIPLITAKIVKNGFIQQPEEFIAEEDYDAWMVRGLPQAGDVVLTTEAPLGEVAQLSHSRVALAQRIVSLRGKSGVLDNGYLKYFLLSDMGQSRLKERETGTTVTGIKQSELRLVKIDLPPFNIQRRIAAILSALDEKIELNRQTNATLEAIAQAIFKEWFVDFNFPGATGEMVESELGMIPRGWEVKPLSEAIEVNPSRALRKGEIAPYLDMSNIPTQGHRGVEWIDRPFGSGTKFINGDTLLARITPCLENGKTAFVDFLAVGQTGWGSTEYIVLHPKAPLSPEYGYYLARTDDLRNHAIQNMSGTSGRQRTPASSLDNFLMVVPEEVVAKQFGGIAASIISQIRTLDEESRTLAAIRDELLPKVMRGEIEV